MSKETFFCNTLAYIWVVRVLECPSILETVIKGTSLLSVMVVAKLWRAIWKVRFLNIWAFWAKIFNFLFTQALVIEEKTRPSSFFVLLSNILRAGFKRGTIKVSPVFFRLFKINWDPSLSLWILCQRIEIISEKERPVYRAKTKSSWVLISDLILSSKLVNLSISSLVKNSISFLLNINLIEQKKILIL